MKTSIPPVVAVFGFPFSVFLCQPSLNSCSFSIKYLDAKFRPNYCRLAGRQCSGLFGFSLSLDRQGFVLSFHLSAKPRLSARRVTNRGFSVFLWRGRQRRNILETPAMATVRISFDGDLREHVSFSLKAVVWVVLFSTPAA